MFTVTAASYLKTLNVRGNKFELDEVRSKLLEWAPSITVLDSDKVAGKHKSFLHPEVKPGTSTGRIDMDADSQVTVAKKTTTSKKSGADGTAKRKEPKTKKAVQEQPMSIAEDAPSRGKKGTRVAAQASLSTEAGVKKKKSKQSATAATEASASTAAPGGLSDPERLKKKKRKVDQRVAAPPQPSSAPAAAGKQQQSKVGVHAAKKRKREKVGAPAASVVPPTQPAPARGQDAASIPAASGVVAIQAGSKKATTRKGFDPSSLGVEPTAANSLLGVGVSQW